MPLFEFRCSACRRDFELLIRSGDRAACPQCGTDRVEKLLSEAAAPGSSGMGSSGMGSSGMGSSGMGSAGTHSLPLTSACPPGVAPCSPTCCRL